MGAVHLVAELGSGWTPAATRTGGARNVQVCAFKRCFRNSAIVTALSETILTPIFFSLLALKGSDEVCSGVLAAHMLLSLQQRGRNTMISSFF
jgi:hypothetical protein